MKSRISPLRLLVLALVVPFTTMTVAAQNGSGVAPPRPEGPCDIYAAAGAPCAAAHSTTRALFASYNGPLYQVMRQSDGQLLDIGVVQPTPTDAGGYADARAQDAFCADTYCWITLLYDQSGMENHLEQAPKGAFIGPALGGFNTLPMADMAPVTLNGHKVYGIFIAPGMGLRQNDPRGTAVDDQAQGQYWVVNGHHYNDGCCFNYGNAETDSRDDGDGTMETTYFGNATLWYHGAGEGPWVMTDQENNLVGCVNESPEDKYCPELSPVDWRFVTATADGEPGHWRSMGGDARGGELQIMYDGGRIINDRSSYDPMRKQGAILLGNGGDNNNYSQGTIYEAAMTAANTFPNQETNQRIQDNVVAAGYNVPLLTLAPASAVDAPPLVQTYSPLSTERATLTFTNTTGVEASDVELTLDVPRGWSAAVSGSGQAATFVSVAPGESVRATFEVTSGSASFNGDMVGRASWTDGTTGQSRSEIAPHKVRNAPPLTINEFRISAGFNTSDSFIELYNAAEAAVDISGWTLTPRATQLPIFSSVEIPSGTSIPAGGFYVLGLSTSGLAVPTGAGDATLFVRSVEGLTAGQEIQIGTGAEAETRTIASVGTAAGILAGRWGPGVGGADPVGGPTTLWQPIPDGPVITIPTGSNSVPVTDVAGFEVGQKMAIGYGATYPNVAGEVERYEVVTVTEVGKPGTQAWLSMRAYAGDTNVKVSSTENISVGDEIRLDINSEGYCIETVTVTRVGTPSERNTFAGPLTADEDPGTGLDLAEPLKCDHASNMPFSAWGTGITFEPATRFPHSSNEPVLPLGTGVTLDQPLANDHAINAVVHVADVDAAGYQGMQQPDQWFGGPALNPTAGSMVLRDAAGRVVESLNYGSIVDPWLAEGYHGVSGAEERGCYAPSPVPEQPRRRGVAPAPTAAPDRSAGRVADGLDTDSNCSDFQVQTVTTMATASAAGSNNVKVAGVEGFSAGQTVIVDTGRNRETAVIATVGTPGATTLTTTTAVGATELPVASTTSFSAGQTITIDSGANQETVVVSSIPRLWFRPGGLTITVASPLTMAHAEGVQISGGGITFTTALTQAHESGAPIARSVSTPGEPNRYDR